MTGEKRAHAQNKSSILDVLNNKFDRAVKFSLNRTWLPVYVYLKYEQTNLLLFFYVTSNSKLQLVS